MTSKFWLWGWSPEHQKLGKCQKWATNAYSRVGPIWPFSSNLIDPTWNWRVYLLWAPKSTKKSYLTMGNPSAMATCYWPPANLRIFRSFSKYVILYTNRCEISCWFQKCITSYVYLEYFFNIWMFPENPNFELFSCIQMRISSEIFKINMQSYTSLKSA